MAIHLINPSYGDDIEIQATGANNFNASMQIDSIASSVNGTGGSGLSGASTTDKPTLADVQEMTIKLTLTNVDAAFDVIECYITPHATTTGGNQSKRFFVGSTQDLSSLSTANQAQTYTFTVDPSLVGPNSDFDIDFDDSEALGIGDAAVSVNVRGAYTSA